MSHFSPTPSKRSHIRSRSFGATSLLVGIVLASCAPGPKGDRRLPQTAGRETAENIPEVIADPFEPWNRGVTVANQGLLFGFIRPTARAYRAVVPKPARNSVNKFAYNITYPGRLVNNVLQGKWKGAGDESVRFLTNTTVGLGGFFDPATKWNIPKSDARFAQTFYKWGWSPHFFVALPFFGPSDDRGTTGRIADRAVEPSSYYAPLAIASGVTTLNELSDQTEPIVQVFEVEPDAYAVSKYFWTYAGKQYAPNWETDGTTHPATLETLTAAFIRTDDPEFAIRAKERSVRLSSTGKKAKFNFWLQKGAAPLVFVAPGIGSHRLSANTLAIAENLYQNGYSVVTTVGIFHPEFMEKASTVALPAYPPIDSKDLLVYLTEINQSLEKKYPGRFTQRALVGFSLGGFQSLYLAAKEKGADSGLLRFDRYVAVNPPVNLLHGDKALDAYFDAANDWPADQRQFKINNSIHKVAALTTLPPEKLRNPPIDATESKYLVGLAFRIVLRDAIWSSQYRNNLGVIQTPLNKWRRDAAYDEILNYSFQDYFKLFAKPYFADKGITSADFKRETNLRSYQGNLRSNPKVRIITNRNDFLLESGDISWLQSTFGSSRLKLFATGGHTGNLAFPQVEDSHPQIPRRNQVRPGIHFHKGIAPYSADDLDSTSSRHHGI